MGNKYLIDIIDLIAIIESAILFFCLFSFLYFNYRIDDNKLDTSDFVKWNCYNETKVTTYNIYPYGHETFKCDSATRFENYLCKNVSDDFIIVDNIKGEYICDSRLQLINYHYNGKPFYYLNPTNETLTCAGKEIITKCEIKQR